MAPIARFFSLAAARALGLVALSPEQLERALGA